MARGPRKPKGKPITREQLLRGTGAKPDDMLQAEREAFEARGRADMDAFSRLIQPSEYLQRIMHEIARAERPGQAQVEALAAGPRQFMEHPFRTAIRLARKAGDPKTEAMARDAMAAFRKGEKAEASSTVMVVLTFLFITAEPMRSGVRREGVAL
jgi:hypothetical protein